MRPVDKGTQSIVENLGRGYTQRMHSGYLHNPVFELKSTSKASRLRHTPVNSKSSTWGLGLDIIWQNPLRNRFVYCTKSRFWIICTWCVLVSLLTFSCSFFSFLISMPNQNVTARYTADRLWTTASIFTISCLEKLCRQISTRIRPAPLSNPSFLCRHSLLCQIPTTRRWCNSLRSGG